MSQKKYITIVHFTAYTREMKEVFVDNESIMRYNLKRRISQICHTYLINKIEFFEGTLVNTEVFKKQTPEPNPQLDKVLKTLDE